VAATTSGATTPANFSLTNVAAAVVVITATSGGGQTATVGTAFTNSLVATVTTNGTPTSGLSVTFTAPSSGASGLFADGGSPAITDTETTDSSGNATSTIFTANSTAGTYNVSASVSGAASPATFGLTNSALTLGPGNYVFQLAGTDVRSGTKSFYAVAGQFTVGSGGTITGGEQDFTDINNVVSDIAAGAKEQASGLDEINTAINHMDQVTQQNAAMVEETTAASRSLSQETSQLSDLIGQFRVDAASEALAIRGDLQTGEPRARRRRA